MSLRRVANPSSFIIFIFMKTSLSHLPEIKQEQILHITEIIKEVALPERVILFGSYAKGRQINHRYTGKDGIVYEYNSDYDFLVVTRKNTLKEYELEDIITNRTSHLTPSVNIQIHEIDYINEGLETGQYFFTDIINEGILLHDTGKVNFSSPRLLSPVEEKKITQQSFHTWFPLASDFLDTSKYSIDRQKFKIAAFILHQATESLYYTTLLVFTGYKPKTHNLWKLRKQAKVLSEELFLAFPIETEKRENHLFDLLKRGYIDARYKADYAITKEELEELFKRIERMKQIVERLCRERIASIHA